MIFGCNPCQLSPAARHPNRQISHGLSCMISQGDTCFFCLCVITDSSYNAAGSYCAAVIYCGSHCDLSHLTHCEPPHLVCSRSQPHGDIPQMQPVTVNCKQCNLHWNTPV